MLRRPTAALGRSAGLVLLDHRGSVAALVSGALASAKSAKQKRSAQLRNDRPMKSKGAGARFERYLRLFRVRYRSRWGR
jgi:hypothetical protein